MGRRRQFLLDNSDLIDPSVREKVRAILGDPARKRGGFSRRSYLLSGGFGGEARIWTLGGDLVGELVGHESSVNAILVSRDGSVSPPSCMWLSSRYRR